MKSLDEARKAEGVGTGALWRPIETAPRNGSEIILGSPGCAFTGFWQTAKNYWGEIGWYAESDRGNGWYAMHPDRHITHWMPLPEPP
jgi:hypothetical protein